VGEKYAHAAFWALVVDEPALLVAYGLHFNVAFWAETWRIQILLPTGYAVFCGYSFYPENNGFGLAKI
jgi:hypothetical protein